MENLYFQPNLFTGVNQSRDFYLFSINPKLSTRENCNWIYISHKNKNYIKLDIGKNSKDIVSFMMFGTPETIIYEDKKFPKNSFLYTESVIALTTSFPINTDYHLEIDFKPKLEVFTDAAMLTIGPKPINGPYFLIHEKNSIGVLIDNQLIINAIVILNITKKEMAELKKFHLKDALTLPYKEPRIDLKKTIPMENKKCFIKKFTELKNINIWHLLYYCYQRRIIDDEFLIDFATEMLEQGKTKDATIIEMAASVKTSNFGLKSISK
jgi:hypothetical protein